MENHWIWITLFSKYNLFYCAYSVELKNRDFGEYFYTCTIPNIILTIKVLFTIGLAEPRPMFKL